MNPIEQIHVTRNQSTGFQRLILVMTLLLVFMMASRTPLDSDLWWHLQSGRVMVESGKPLLTDVFSYTRYGQEWVNHSWLGEVVLYGIYQSSGWTGISAWMGILAAAVAGLLWSLIPGGVFSRGGFILLATVACGPLFTPRPQLFSLLFLVLLIWLVERWRRHGGKAIWWIIPLFAFWSNLHGGYVLGILFLLTWAVGMWMDAAQQVGVDRTKSLRQSGLVLAAAVGAYAAAAVNPNGYRMWLIPFQTVGVGILRQFIQEWASPDFHSIESWAFALYLLILMFGLSRRMERVPFFQILPSLLFILMALYARRNMAAAVVISLPMLVETWTQSGTASFISGFIPQSVKGLWERYKDQQKADLPETQRRVINLLFAGLLGLFCFFKLAAVTHPVLMTTFERKGFPLNAVKYLSENKGTQTGRLFNAYNWGGYIVWKNPDTRVFVDGRTDLFGDEILGEWLTMTQAGDGWQAMLKKWDISRVIIEPDRPLTTVLASNGWVERYRDKQAVIFDRGSK
jgi:hypothetical protein